MFYLNKFAKVPLNFPLVTVKRHLNIHEHMSYAILRQNGIPVPKFEVVKDPDVAIKAAECLETDSLIMKAQVLTGGRGKGKFKKSGKPGVVPFSLPQDAEGLASAMIGDLLITKQTGSTGKICNSVIIAQRSKAAKEYYLSITMDRANNGPLIISSSQGGVDIEKVASENPEAINKTPVDIIDGLETKTAEEIACGIGLESRKEEVGEILKKMYDIFIKLDSSLIEINPFIVDENEQLLCLDAKINFDDSAKFRQKEIFALRDLSQENDKEITADSFNLSYVALDGNIGCMVNGAGLAMATLDIVKLSGGDPANFLDVGGGADVEHVEEAFKIIMSDEKVNAIYVNIFGGIMKCDIIATGIISAIENSHLNVPLVVRLQGTNYLEAKDILNASKLKITAIDDFDDSARKVVELSQK